MPVKSIYKKNMDKRTIQDQQKQQQPHNKNPYLWVITILCESDVMPNQGVSRQDTSFESLIHFLSPTSTTTTLADYARSQ